MVKPQKPADWLNEQANIWYHGAENSLFKGNKEEVSLTAAVSAAFRLAAQKAEREGWSVQK